MLIVTDQARIDIAKARAGEIPMPKIETIEIGNAGHSGSLPITVTPDMQSLNNKVMEKVAFHIGRTDNRNVYQIEILENELNGEPISEIGLRADNGTLVALQTFAPKYKESDNIFTFDITEEF